MLPSVILRATMPESRRPKSALGFGTRSSEPRHEAFVRLTLLNGFEATVAGTPIALSSGLQRLLAFLALRARPMLRLHVAGTLWLDSPEDHAMASLRTALWRLHREAAPQLVETTPTHVGLERAVSVDLREIDELAHRVLRADRCTQDDLARLGAAGELLPGWYDDWVLVEQERFRQLRLHALEAVAESYVASGLYGAAIEVGLAAVASDPVRESAHRVVIRAHLAEGNHREAIRQYQAFERLAWRYGIRPSPEMIGLVQAAQLPPR